VDSPERSTLYESLLLSVLFLAEKFKFKYYGVSVCARSRLKENMWNRIIRRSEVNQMNE